MFGGLLLLNSKKTNQPLKKVRANGRLSTREIAKKTVKPLRNFLYFPSIRKLIRMVAAEKIGKILNQKPKEDSKIARL